MTTVSCFLTAMLLGQIAQLETRYAPTGGNPVLEKTLIFVKDEADIPAQETGSLTQLPLREGARVKKGDLIAVIDNRPALAAVTVAEYAYQAARKRAAQTIEIKYAAAAAAVAEAEVEQDREVNRNLPGAVPESEVRKKQLDFTRAGLQIDKAQNDRVMASYDAKTKKAELDAARMALGRHTISAPFDGEVVKTYVHKSEWVNPGEPILKLMRFDKLLVEGRVSAKDYNRSEIIGKPVTVEVTKARGQKVAVSGTIIYADQKLVLKGVYYKVRAEVKNELINGSWQLQPGGVARMTIHLDQTSRESRVESPESGKKRR